MFLILWLQNKGFRWIEALIISLMALIAACFVVLIAQADPVWGEVIAGFAPSREILGNPTMLYLALGIIGATVMPHNLYLHSGIVQTRVVSRMWWKLASSALRACNVGSGQAARSRDIGTRG